MKTLVVYYSFSGKTEVVAKTIAEKLGADVRRIEETKSRTNFFSLYLEGGIAASQDKCTEIKPCDTDFTGYDLIFIGTPNWANRPVPGINTFIARADFHDKQVIAFCTMGGRSGWESLFTHLNRKIEAKSGRVIGRFAIRSSGVKDEELGEKTGAELEKLALAIAGSIQTSELSIVSH